MNGVVGSHTQSTNMGRTDGHIGKQVERKIHKKIQLILVHFEFYQTIYTIIQITEYDISNTSTHYQLIGARNNSSMYTQTLVKQSYPFEQF